jgi:hypothetical protein
MLATVHNRFGAPDSLFGGAVTREGEWRLDAEVLLLALTEAEKTQRPVYLLGTAFSYVHLLDWLTVRQTRLALSARSRLFVTGGYKGRSRSLPPLELQAWLYQRLGVAETAIVGEYGMSELSSQAYDRTFRPTPASATPPPRVFRFPPWCRTQIVSPETTREVADGQIGLLRVFDLANVSSVMAIQTEDLAIRYGEGFALLGRASEAEPRGCSLMSA